MSTDENSLTYIFQGGDATLYLSVDPQGFIFNPNEFSFTTKACYIYAETIIIPNANTFNVHTNGQTLGIFCNQMEFSGTKSATFDVSGNNGTDNATNQGDLNGKNSGNFFLYVENVTDPVFHYLNIRACGGTGGRGVSYTTDNVGGTGGNGGNGGNANVVFGSTFFNLADSVHKNLTSPWPQQASNVSVSVLPIVNILTNTANTSLQVSYNATQASTWQLAISNYNTYAKTLQDLTASLAKIGNPPSRTGGHPGPGLINAAAALQKTINMVLQGVQSPSSVPADTGYIQTLEQAIDDFMKKGGQAREQTVTNCISSFPTISVSSTSDLANALQDFLNTSIGLVTEVRGILSHNIVNTNRGIGGLGGYSGTGVSPYEGAQGTPGKSGSSSAQNLYFDGSPLDSTTSVPFVFPEQCRMLLNLADSYYFVANPNSWATAITYYQRLVNRLSFLDAQNVGTSNLASALQYLAFPLQLTWNPLNELASIYTTAQNRLSQVKLGQDMFGHSENWVPRLSAAYYKQRVEAMLPQLQTMETAIATFTTQNQTTAIKLEQCKVGIANAQAGLQSAQDRIQLISGQGGLLPTYEYQIQTTMPLIQPALDNINQQLKAIAEELIISSKTNWDDLLNAFSMLAMCPEALMGITEIGTLMYKTSTELTNNDDVEVNKSYVIKQVETCGSTLDSLNETFKQNTNGSIDLNDPGANLIFASQSDIDSLLNEFSNIIPPAYITDIDKAFKAYTDLVLKRNGYITSYNTALQLLLQAINDQAYYQQENNTWSQELLQLNPDLPAIMFWLEKNRDDLRFQIMQHLNYEARANRFWGLGIKLTAMISPGPLQGVTDLQIDQTNLDSDFGNCLSSLMDNNMNQWPAEGQSGSFYALPENVLDHLKTVTTPTTNGLIYSVCFAINNGDVQNLNSMANIRLSQVRLWLPGATLTSAPDPQGNQILSIVITQSGDETIYDQNGLGHAFVHDPVSVQFEYICNKVLTFNDCVPTHQWGLQGLSGDYNGTGAIPVGSSVTAPIGPYSTWTVVIKSTTSVNIGLDLSGVTIAYMEFGGRSQALLQVTETESKKECK
ncbi:hypothetical protein TWF696_000902 [Orbilia brochopaga]|uniref:Uncharacterized protein n=1 Tax=Orbilia brochopaga TaxID=3140254 RepID=A0AAV9VFA3_9PEZI